MAKRAVKEQENAVVMVNTAAAIDYDLHADLMLFCVHNRLKLKHKIRELVGNFYEKYQVKPSEK